MDITEQYLQTVQNYNGSDSTYAGNLAASTRLNYASGPTYREAVQQNVYEIPYTLDYEGSLGLEGIENIYVRVNHKPETVADGICIEEPYWMCMAIWDSDESDLGWDGLVFDSAEEGDSPTYEQVQITNRAWFAELSDMYMKVRLDNTGTGNMYQDTNIDCFLYDKSRRPFQYKEMYVPLNGSTTFGIHSRNSKRTGLFNQLTLGTDLKRRSEMTEDDLKLLNTGI